MPRKIILDVDPGIDDALALAIALSDPSVDVVAVTAVGGNIPAATATRNVQAIVEQMDPPKLPRIGAASDPDDGLPVDGRYLHGSDGFGGAGIEVAELRTPHPSEKLICDTVRADPNSVTIVALGPLTNIARAFQRDPELPSLVGQIVIAGGAVSCSGNITPAAEFNIYCDPQSARAVFRSFSTKTLIPLDVTNRVVLTYDVLNRLPAENTRIGRLLRRILPPAFRAYHHKFGLEGIHVHDTVALMHVFRPGLFTMREMAGDVETMGDLTLGATVFDRRRVPAWRPNMEVATELNAAETTEQILALVSAAAKRG